MSNSLPSGSAMHRHRKPSSSRVFPVRASGRRASYLRRRLVEVVHHQVEVHPVLAQLGVGHPLEPDREAVVRRRQDEEFSVADLRVHGYGEQAAPEPGQGRRVGGVDHEITHLRWHISLPPTRD